MIARTVQSAKIVLSGFLLLLPGCADPPPSMPEVTGTIAISASIEINPDSLFVPESVFVILDGDSIGNRSNPVKLRDIEVGEHFVSTFIQFDDTCFRSPVYRLLVAFNTTVAIETKMSSTGVLAVSPLIDNQPVDSCCIRLDGIVTSTEGINPAVIRSVTTGTHSISVSTSIDTIHYEGWRCDAVVSAAETTFVDIDMQSVSPYVGFHSPDINCLDIDGRMCSLSEHWGEVIFLYFFTST